MYEYELDTVVTDAEAEQLSHEFRFERRQHVEGEWRLLLASEADRVSAGLKIHSLRTARWRDLQDAARSN